MKRRNYELACVVRDVARNPPGTVQIATWNAVKQRLFSSRQDSPDMLLGNSTTESPLFEEDNDQSKPLLSDDCIRDNDGGGRGISQPKKLAEYLPTSGQDLGLARRVFRGLYGQLQTKDIPRVLWVRRYKKRSPIRNYL